MPPIISIVGKSDSGKTTLLEKLIPCLKQKGYRIAVVKHTHHDTFPIDKEGKDSYRHKVAGADAVMVASANRIAMVKDVSVGSPEDIAEYFHDADLIITEGFKQTNNPKIEVCRAARSEELVCQGDSNLIAVATDMDVRLDVPRFGLNEVSGLADFIEETLLKRNRSR